MYGREKKVCSSSIKAMQITNFSGVLDIMKIDRMLNAQATSCVERGIDVYELEKKKVRIGKKERYIR